MQYYIAERNTSRVNREAQINEIMELQRVSSENHSLHAVAFDLQSEG